MKGNKSINKWLLHIAGYTKLDNTPFHPMKKKAFELNRDNDFIDFHYGKRETKAFVGFIDLVNFSKKVEDMSPKQVKDYLQPFLKKTIDVLTTNYCLIDKTIGDEVMFVLPDLTKMGLPSRIIIGRILNFLFDEVKSKEYKFRLGLSYGYIWVDKINAKDYGELTSFGIVVNLAKRLHEAIKAQHNLVDVAIGCIKEAEDVDMINLLKSDAKVVWENFKVYDGEIIPLKGISEYDCFFLTHKEPSDA